MHQDSSGSREMSAGKMTGIHKILISLQKGTRKLLFTVASNRNKMKSVRPACGRIKTAKGGFFHAMHSSAVELLAMGRDAKNLTKFIKHSDK